MFLVEKQIRDSNCVDINKIYKEIDISTVDLFDKHSTVLRFFINISKYILNSYYITSKVFRRKIIQIRFPFNAFHNNTLP